MSKQNIIRTLRRARNIIRTKGWTQGFSARNADRRYTDPRSTEAVCFCILGAIDRANNELQLCSGSKAADVIRDVTPTGLIAEWNDHPNRTKSQVLAIFGEAIAKVEARL